MRSKQTYKFEVKKKEEEAPLGQVVIKKQTHTTYVVETKREIVVVRGGFFPCTKEQERKSVIIMKTISLHKHTVSAL